MLTPIQKESFCSHNPMEPNIILDGLFESLRNVIFRDVPINSHVPTLRGIYRPVCDSIMMAMWQLISGSLNADFS